MREGVETPIVMQQGAGVRTSKSAAVVRIRHRSGSESLESPQEVDCPGQSVLFEDQGEALIPSTSMVLKH